MAESTVDAVLRLFEQDCSLKEIQRRLGISHNKVTQILVTSGAKKPQNRSYFFRGTALIASVRSLENPVTRFFAVYRTARVCTTEIIQQLTHSEYGNAAKKIRRMTNP